MAIIRKKLKDGKQAAAYISDFFTMCENEKWIPTLTRLANYLGMNREALVRYGRADRPADHSVEISEAIQDARSRIEAMYEDMLLTRPNVGGVTFALKNNFGWTDRMETNNTSSGSIEVSWGAPSEAPGFVNVTPEPVAVPAAPLVVDVAGSTSDEDESDPLLHLFDD